MRKAKRFLALLTAAVVCVASAVPALAASAGSGIGSDLKDELVLPNPIYEKIMADKVTGVDSTITYQGGTYHSKYTMTYDVSGKMEKAYIKDDDDEGRDYRISYDYNAKGQRTKTSMDDGSYIEYEYSGDQLVKDIDHSVARIGCITTTTYTYNKDGKLAKKASTKEPGASGFSETWSETYSYNADGTVATMIEDESMTYNNQTDVDKYTTTYSYKHDSTGNLTQVTSKRVDASGEAETINKEYNCTYKDGKIASITTKEAEPTTYTFTYAANASEPTKPAEPATSTGFSDVKDSAYYANAVKWAVEREITKGLSATAFGPDQKCTRAQIVTFLYKQAGSPDVSDVTLPFTDVKAGAYYENAVKWAVKNNITSGLTATTFAPNATCTRAQIVTFLYKANGQEAAASTSLPFTDVAAGAYYETPVAWAVQKNVTGGTTKTTFSPNAACTRAQAVSFLYRAASGK